MEHPPVLPGDRDALSSDHNAISLLYVEDEAEPRGMVSRMLAMNYPNLTIYSAENGLLGLNSYREHLPEVVVTDINMPEMDGIRMAREIRTINPEALIIAVTAHSDTSYLLSAINIGIHRYVLKPINYDELFKALDSTIEEIMLKRLVKEQNRRIAESERQLAHAQKISHLGSWQLNLGEGTLQWSEEFARICGLPPDTSAFPYLSFFLEMVHRDDRDSLGRELSQTMESRQPLVGHFCRIRRPDGTLRTIRVDAECLFNPAGEPTALLGTALDVTKIKQAEDEIRSLTEELERRVVQRTSLLQSTLQELEGFNYLVSHDLRAPLARLEGYCRALLEDCGDCMSADCRTYAESADRVVRQVKNIIDAFNNLSSYAKCSMVVEELDLSPMALSIMERLRSLDPQRVVEFDCPGHLVVKGDPRLLYIALEHLLGNAWKFSSKTDAARIEFGCREENGSRVFFVRDNGAGFNMKYLDKLFKPFQSIHSPDEFPVSGSAIGLAAVHSIILRHGGTVWATGEVGKGASFYFTLAENPESGSYLKAE